VQKEKFSDSAKDKANVFSKPFEQNEDARFFDELNAEMESDQPQETRLQWMLSMADRAETILKSAFDAGPRSSEQRYRARAAALARFHGGLRSEKVLPTLAAYYRQQKVNHQQRANKEIPSNAAP
jgi:CRISPR system Cascade subunit CasA